MPKEYKIEQERIRWKNADEETKYLNQMSIKGWDLVTILDYIKFDGVSVLHSFEYYFSREIETGSKLRELQLKEEPNDKPESSPATGEVPKEGV